MPIGIDFARLDLRSALDFAIGVEEDAQLRYEEFAASVQDPAIVRFFSEMVVNERKHRRQLEARRDVLFRHAPPRFDTSIVEDVEAPGRGELAVVRTVREAMELALRAEERAYTFYASAIPHLKDPDVRALFEELKEEEAAHQAAVRKMIGDLTS